ncbi:hypothetical protein SDC9_166763 [bioreactor metagenome]|uniref:Uncharacterized protein n=1 Tax=bioreactor metagenome TaxID=1076179 RepID=A0A645G5H6_9ZZZZ
MQCSFGTGIGHHHRNLQQQTGISPQRCIIGRENHKKEVVITQIFNGNRMIYFSVGQHQQRSIGNAESFREIQRKLYRHNFGSIVQINGQSCLSTCTRLYGRKSNFILWLCIQAL